MTAKNECWKSSGPRATFAVAELGLTNRRRRLIRCVDHELMGCVHLMAMLPLPPGLPQGPSTHQISGEFRMPNFLPPSKQGRQHIEDGRGFDELASYLDAEVDLSR